MTLQLFRSGRHARALALLASLWLGLAAPSLASQATLVTPGPPLPMSGLASFLNAALLSIGSCNSGNSAPANGTGGAAFPGECWINTTSSPWVFSFTADAVHWSEFGTLNISTFAWTGYSNGFSLSLGGNLSTAGAFTQAGAFPATLTFTGTTNATFPAGTHTLTVLDVIQTWTAAQSFTDGTLILLGSSSGTAVLKAPATAGSTVMALPVGTDVLVAQTTTQTLTNKTFNCNNNTCTVRIGSDVTGLGTGVATALGLATNVAGGAVVSTAALTAFGIVYGGGSGSSPGSTAAGSNGQLFLGVTSGAPQWGTMSGDVAITNTGAATVQANAVTNAKMATMTAWTFKANATSGGATPTDITIDGQTLKASPAAGDEVFLWDVAGTALKKTTVSALASAGSVGSLNGQTGTLTLLTEPMGRLTLQANTPVMTTSQAAQSTLRYDAYIGNQVPYYTGSADGLDTIASNEVTDAMVSAASAGQVVSGQVYDVWWVHGGANRICLAMSTSTGGGGGWASDTAGSNTARGTGYSQLDRVTRPYPTNKNSISNCFNAATNYGPVSANQATYLGTIFATANGQTAFIYGAAASPGTPAQLYVWNMFHRVDVTTVVKDTTASWSYATNTVRVSDNSTNNRISFVSGLAEDGVTASFLEQCNTGSSTGNQCSFGFQLDGTSAYDYSQTAATPVANGLVSGGATSSTYPAQVGQHFIQSLENSESGTSTFIGGSRYGLSSHLRM